MTVDPTILPRDQHPISRKLISQNALKVLHRLNGAGHEAYLVGGGVRDILLGMEPKDFDIATSAHPEEVHDLFRNSRLIGRRFKLVHIMFGREIIEVATFRAAPSDDQDAHKQSDEGLLLRDNVYGTLEEDAIRRDFTVNSLYYSSKDFTVVDYANGLDDIADKQIKLIGDPATRYREDPVRMLRAIRFANKLNFEIEHDTEAAIFKSAELISHVAPARLFEEILKLFLSGNAERNFIGLEKYGLLNYLFEDLSRHLSIADAPLDYREFILEGLRNTDSRIRQEKPVTPAFLYATLLWPEVHRQWQQRMSENTPAFPAMYQASQSVLRDQQKYISIPKRFSLMMKEIWEYQIRLGNKNPRKAKHLLYQSRFRAAYDFLLLREQAGEALNGLGSWWTQFQEKNPAPGQTDGGRKNQRPSGRRRRYGNKPRES